MKKAKKEIQKRKLDLSKWKDLIIAIGIVIAIVGFAICAPECLPALLAVV